MRHPKPKQAYSFPPALLERALAVCEADEKNVVPVPVSALKTAFKETLSFLESSHRQVLENKDVLGVSLFIRWFRMSGFLKVIARSDVEDAEHLDRLCRDILFDCEDALNGRKVSARYQASDIEDINRKLDFLCSKFFPADTQTVEAVVKLPAALLAMPAGSSTCGTPSAT